MAIARRRQRRRNPVQEFQTNVQRVGQAPSYSQDLYSWLFMMKWRALFALFAAYFTLANVLFACFYLMAPRPGGITGAQPGSFVDAFFFSVQTFSTIGYGAMSPKGLFTNMVVTVESVVGMLSVALVTGIIFAKFARPSSGVVFTNKMVHNYRNKTPCLMFRVANARGSNIIEATLRVTVLLDDVTEEGERLRKLHDLSLMRSTSPILTMSWLVVHEIDENSPIYGMDQDALIQGDVRFIISMTGIDGTYAQSIHAYYMYYAENVVFDAKFVDVVFPQDDGTFKLDLRQFDDVVTKSVPRETA